MEVVTKRVGDAIPNPADRLGPAIGYLADQWDGEVLIVLRTHPEETAEQLRHEAWRIHRIRRNKRRRMQNRLDKPRVKGSN